MVDNVTNTLLAQLLMRPSRDAVPQWLQPYYDYAVSLPAQQSALESRWPSSDGLFEPRPQSWFRPEQMHNGETIVPGKSDPFPPHVFPRYDPFRRRLEEFDAEYPRRPLHQPPR